MFMSCTVDEGRLLALVYDDGIVGGVDAAGSACLRSSRAALTCRWVSRAASSAADFDLAAGTLKISQEGHAYTVDRFVEHLPPDAASADGSSYLCSGRGSNAG
jgi:hypothetical protein